MIDPDGDRPNVGIILLRRDGRVFWARRVSRDGWQFPQGGMRTDETPEEAMYRELQEETGLRAEHVELLGATPGWLRYRLPKRFVRQREKPLCIGQKQVWFLVRLLCSDRKVRLDACPKPEFDRFRWVDFWYPAEHVVHFKRGVYRRALTHFEPLLAPSSGISNSTSMLFCGTGSLSRDSVSDWAPTIVTIKIDPEKIRDVIGKGGATIRQITEETGATIDIDNDGTVKIASVEGAAGREAQRRIELITAEVEVGAVYEGRVARLMDFGAFVTILPGKDGLVHISQISEERVEKVSDKLAEGDKVKVKVLEVDKQGRIRLSMKAVAEEAEA